MWVVGQGHRETVARMCGFVKCSGIGRAFTYCTASVKGGPYRGPRMNPLTVSNRLGIDCPRGQWNPPYPKAHVVELVRSGPVPTCCTAYLFCTTAPKRAFVLESPSAHVGEVRGFPKREWPTEPFLHRRSISWSGGLNTARYTRRVPAAIARCTTNLVPLPACRLQKRGCPFSFSGGLRNYLKI